MPISKPKVPDLQFHMLNFRHLPANTTSPTTSAATKKNPHFFRGTMGLVKNVRCREIKNDNPVEFKRTNFSHRQFVEAIGHSRTLQGHDGCVNTISWNHSGTLLISGSDDRNIMVWDGNDGHSLHRMATEHMNNIFSVLFVPDTSDRQVISAAADRQVLLHDLDHQNISNPIQNGLRSGASQHVHKWQCDSRVKRLAVTQALPKLFWSASEDGVLRQYDLRMKEAEKLVDLSNRSYQMKSLAVNDQYPELIAIALNDSMVPIYDRRNTKSPVLRLLPGHLSIYSDDERRALRSALVTHVAFNSRGDEIVANIGSDNIYIYNIMDSKSAPNVLGALRTYLDEPDEFMVTDHEEFLNDKMEQELVIKETRSSCDSLFKDVRKLAKIYVKKKEYTKAIDLCSTEIHSYTNENRLPRFPDPYDPYEFIHEKRNACYTSGFSRLLAQRGFCYFERQWEGDTMAAMRDFLQSLHVNGRSNKAVHYFLLRTLVKMKQTELATTCYDLYIKRFPNGVSNGMKDLQKQLELLQADEKSDLRPTWDTDVYEKFRDYVDRFCGSYNVNTDIKEANWFGGNDEMVVGGSDCGSLFIWERATGKVLRLFKADEYSVNTVQCHPNRLLIATSGIDHVIRFWEPGLQDKKSAYASDTVYGEERDHTGRIYDVVQENNQQTPFWNNLVHAHAGIEELLSSGIFGEEFQWRRGPGNDPEGEGDGAPPPGIACRTM